MQFDSNSSRFRQRIFNKESQKWEGLDGSQTSSAFRRKLSPPAKKSFGWTSILKECEEHTTWLNKVLQVRCQLVGDLRKSTGDGLMLVHLLEILTNEKIPGIHPQPVNQAQKINNLQLCLHILKRYSVQMRTLNAKDLIDGSLMPILMLLSNIRQKFDPGYKPRDKRGIESSIPICNKLGNGKNTPNAIIGVTDKSRLENTMKTTTFQETVGRKAIDINSGNDPRRPPEYRRPPPPPYPGNSDPPLPGTLSSPSLDSVLRHSLPEHIITKTDLDSQETLSMGVDAQNQEILSLSQFNKQHQRPRSAGKSSVVPEPPLVAKPQAWSITKPTVPIHDKPGLLDQRLRSLLNHSPDTSRKPDPNLKKEEDEGEFLLPPPVKSRQPLAYPDGLDNPALTNGSLQPGDFYPSGFLPSHPAQRTEGPRGQALLDKYHSSGNSSHGHSSINLTYSTDSSTTSTEMANGKDVLNGDWSHRNGHADGPSSDDLRDAWNKIYGKDQSMNTSKNQKSPSSQKADITPKPRILQSDKASTSQDIVQSLTDPKDIKEDINKKSPIDKNLFAGKIDLKENHKPGSIISRNLSSSQSKPTGLFNKSKERELDFISDFQHDLDGTISESSSVTPPLPPLSPSNTPPATPHDSPHLLAKFKRSLSATALNSTPDLLETASTEKSGSKQRISAKKTGVRRTTSSQGGIRPWESKYSKNPSLSITSQKVMINRSAFVKPKKQALQTLAVFAPLSDVKEAASETLDSADLDSVIDSLADTEKTSTMADYSSDYDASTLSVLESQESDNIRGQLDYLETMYQELLKLLGVDEKALRNINPRTRTGGHDRLKSGEKRRKKDIKAVSRRFVRLESHVVTLARSVAHLSSEMRSQNVMFQELETIRRDIHSIREQQSVAGRQRSLVGAGDLARLNQGLWLQDRPNLQIMSNPTRINKLTKFFGDEPPLLRLFLKKLGYEKYAVNFEAEKIGVLELPYLNEERLQKLGIPMGPRLRILQEAQIIFRHENINTLYIV